MGLGVKYEVDRSWSVLVLVVCFVCILTRGTHAANTNQLVYVTDQNSIFRTDLTSTATITTCANGAEDVVADANWVYWVNGDAAIYASALVPGQGPASNCGNAIVNVPGGAVGAASVYRLAIDSFDRYLWFVDSTNSIVYRAPVGGGDPTVVVNTTDTVGPHAFGIGVDMDSDSLIWTEGLEGDAVRGVVWSDLNGTNIQMGLNYGNPTWWPRGVSVDIANSKVLWVERRSTSEITIQEASSTFNPPGSTKIVSGIPGDANSYLTIDGSGDRTLYWSNRVDGNIHRVEIVTNTYLPEITPEDNGLPRGLYFTSLPSLDLATVSPTATESSGASPSTTPTGTPTPTESATWSPGYTTTPTEESSASLRSLSACVWIVAVAAMVALA